LNRLGISIRPRLIIRFTSSGMAARKHPQGSN
jgi:hypothetical protein